MEKQEKIINKFEEMSLKYHKISLLFSELAGSLRIKYKELGEGRVKEFREYIKGLGIDINKLMEVSKEDISVLGKK